MKPLIIISWICRLIAAVIMLQTLYFKFSAAEESVYIFTKVGIEPWGRIGTGIAELIASVLILIPKTTVYGAIVALGIMAGALATHIFLLGIVVMNDGGQLFIYGLLVFIASLVLIIINRKQLLQLLPFKK
ncbi:MAG: DoxX family protein [Chitinophaga sp.]|jgi:hypothetical protein|nr:DoxX family protein [Chitinophaga sp.]